MWRLGLACAFVEVFEQIVTEYLNQTGVVVGIGENTQNTACFGEAVSQGSQWLGNKILSSTRVQRANANWIAEVRQWLIRDTGKPLHTVQSSEYNLEAPLRIGHQFSEIRHNTESVTRIRVKKIVCFVK